MLGDSYDNECQNKPLVDSLEAVFIVYDEVGENKHCGV